MKPMTILEQISLDDVTPAELWPKLDEETRREAARSLYQGRRSDGAFRREADLAIAAAIRFREVAVRKLSADKRIDYLLRSVHPDDSLAANLLLALHLEQRCPVLTTFLDRLEIPHEEGMIDGEFDLQPPPPERLAPAIDALYDGFAREQVEVYLASLLALDPETWAGLPEALRSR